MALTMSIAHAQVPLLLDGLEEGDNFGRSIALDGDYALVGATSDSDFGSFAGAAYVFQREDGQWDEGERLVPDAPAANDFFGISVALANGRAFVGAYEGFDDPGAVYVFRNEEGAWVSEARLTLSSDQGYDGFGGSLAAEGDVVVVGATALDDGRGAVYVFRLEGGEWQEEARLSVPNLAEGDQFGSAVAISGERVVIGAQFADAGAGMAYVFERGSEGWQLTAPLLPVWPDANPHRNFGTSVALRADLAVVGAPGGPIGGSALVFRDVGDTWSVEQELTSSSPSFDDEFGFAVAVSEASGLDEFVLVGARFRDSDANSTSSGNAYLFAMEESGWTERARLRSPDPDEGALFGGALAASGASLLISAQRASEDRGATYVYDLGAVVSTEPVVGIRPEALVALYPNPASGRGSTFILRVPQAQSVAIELIDIQGRRVQEVYRGTLLEGEHPMEIRTSGLPSGLYLVRATGETFQAIGKLLIL